MLRWKKRQYFDVGLYTLIILAVVSIPFFVHFGEDRDVFFYLRELSRLLPFFLILAVNNFILTDKFLFKSKYKTYFLLCALLLAGSLLLDNLVFGNKSLQKEARLPWPEEMASNPPEDAEPPILFGYHPEPDSDLGHPREPIFNLGILVIGILIIGFNNGVKIFVHWVNQEGERGEKERQYLNAELAFLKHQISPHFFMNTLNNIHALVDIDSERSKDAIIKLSRLMNYLLYETDTDRVSLNKEIDFVESYIELMRLRYDESRLSIRFSYSQSMNTIRVPSLLFLPLIENAFKHGVHSSMKCFVDIVFELKDNKLKLALSNSNFPKKRSNFDEGSGIGMENIRKRLDLIYEDRYKLLVDSQPDVFQVTLIIPVE